MTVYVKEFQVTCGVLLIGSCEGNLVMSDWRDVRACKSALSGTLRGLSLKGQAL